MERRAVVMLGLLALVGASRAPPRTRIAFQARARTALSDSAFSVLSVDSALADAPGMSVEHLARLVAEYNEEHATDVVSIALQHTRDVDFSSGMQELMQVKIASMTHNGLELEEVICDTSSDTCVALSVPIVFARQCGSEAELRAELEQMAKLRADAPKPAAITDRDVSTCAGLLDTLNTQFGHTLELYVLRAGGVVLSEEDVLERCRAVALDGTGFTLETIVCHEDGESCNVIEKRVLFYRSCQSIHEIEDALCRLLLVSSTPNDDPQTAQT
ncbi:hypothetical protein T492DRAFT_1100244 [Pavlovales sp. CCMP2436]|nr:hypothetical protein T492DRAFT_1100244 [Pavlovales sp. CCMP2436]|mmetsp:Transcript_11259/g.28447  ORF Transcript_11259/g.28447 Transcript_11259/m.28447 type:complete len:273 (+) Transcript_11259:54-872(+)